MDIEIKIEDKQLEIDKLKFQKMVFLFNALDNGWSIKKKKCFIYIYKKPRRKKRNI